LIVECGGEDLSVARCRLERVHRTFTGRRVRKRSIPPVASRPPATRRRATTPPRPVRGSMPLGTPRGPEDEADALLGEADPPGPAAVSLVSDPVPSPASRE